MGLSLNRYMLIGVGLIALLVVLVHFIAAAVVFFLRKRYYTH